MKDRLLEIRKIDRETGCWNSSLSVDRKGYGQITLWLGVGVKPVLRRVHRVAYEAFVGPTSGLHVLHKCDNPRCFNPEHLFLGTQADNIRDCAAKKRTRGGIRKLSHEEARKIRDLYSKGMTQGKIASLYGMNQSTISSLVNGKTWRSDWT